MKALVYAVCACLVLATSASAQQSDVTFKQSQGDDGYGHIQITVSYPFPGLSPRTNNSGAGTVRITLRRGR